MHPVPAEPLQHLLPLLPYERHSYPPGLLRLRLRFVLVPAPELGSESKSKPVLMSVFFSWASGKGLLS